MNEICCRLARIISTYWKTRSSKRKFCFIFNKFIVGNFEKKISRKDQLHQIIGSILTIHIYMFYFLFKKKRILLAITNSHSNFVQSNCGRYRRRFTKKGKCINCYALYLVAVEILFFLFDIVLHIFSWGCCWCCFCCYCCQLGGL